MCSTNYLQLEAIAGNSHTLKNLLTEGKNGSFMAIRMRIHQKFSSFMTPSWTLKKTGAGGYAQISDCCVTYLLCYSIAGHSLDDLMYLKT